MPSQSNGIIVRDSSQSEFCNTIGGKADMALTLQSVVHDPERHFAARLKPIIKLQT
jgi:hypothetical protein